MLRTTLATAALMVAGMTTAHADGFTFGGADSGWLIGLGVGQHQLEVEDDIGTFFDESGTTWRLITGYRLNKFLAAEVSYIDGGSPAYGGNDPAALQRLDIRVRGFQAAAIGSLPLNKYLSAYGRVGYTQSDVDVRQSNGANRSSSSESEGYFGWGVGGSVLFEGALLRLEYERSSVEYDAFVGSPDATSEMITLSVVWTL